MTSLCDDVTIPLHIKADSWNNLQEVRRTQSNQIFSGKHDSLQWKWRLTEYFILIIVLLRIALHSCDFISLFLTITIDYDLLDPSPSPTPPPPPSFCNSRPSHTTCLEFTWKQGGVVVGRGWGESRSPSSFSSTLPQSAVRQNGMGKRQ